MPTTFPSPASSTREQLTAIQASWGWFVALGAAFVILGLIALAHVATATAVTILYVGAFVFVAGVVQILHAFRIKTWGRFAYWLLSGLFYVVGGALIFFQPVQAAFIFTLMIGVALMVGGVFRIFAGFGARPTTGWGFLVFAGVITLLLGIEITVGWPVNSPYIIGMFLGIDLIFNGVMTAMFGFALRKKQA